MPASKAQQRAVNKYMKANYDRVNLTLPKGQKDVIQVHAAARGESVNGFIGRAITETMERDGGGGDVAKIGGNANAPESPSESVLGGGATPIPDGTETPSEATESITEGG